MKKTLIAALLATLAASPAAYAEKIGVTIANSNPWLTLVRNGMQAKVKTMKGVDAQFGKAKEHLLYPVSQGPFYALEVVTYNLTTIGGIKVNEHLEAVDEASAPVKGLYAVGNVAGGLYSDSYMTVDGTTAYIQLTA